MKLKIVLLIAMILPLFSFNASALEDEMIGDVTLQTAPSCSKTRMKSMLTQLSRAEKSIKKLLKKERLPAFIEDAFKSTAQSPHLGLEMQKRYAKSHYLNGTSEALDLLIAPLQQDAAPTPENQQQLSAVLSAMNLPLQRIIKDRNADPQKDSFERLIVYNSALKAVAKMEMENISGLKDLVSHACDQPDYGQEELDEL